MRPAVTANFLRNRGASSRSRQRNQHVFSTKRLLLMVFTGILLFVPGLALSVAGLDHGENDYQNMAEWKRIIFRAVGPSLCATGAIVMFASCIYYYCYGSNEQPTPPSNHHNHQVGHRSKTSSPNQDEEKGSIRSSKHREHGHHHGHHHHHHHHNHPNGRPTDLNTPDNDCRISFRGSESEGGRPGRTPSKGSPANEEEVPLARMEDGLEQGQFLKVPSITILIQEPSDNEDFDVFEENQALNQNAADRPERECNGSVQDNSRKTR